ncbi:hypothetical protein [Fulvivirga sediminis]|uniref:Uncharacterized protein n=1 Tax=Fulvivirga sediminis TaxID=2803949 RepID=A0A937FBR8_9BACT|nr:hypothetical protein [Fulvivirga sediminis]MBL3657558.1 hypothetical protein [Fulvivirga sediminis]
MPYFVPLGIPDYSGNQERDFFQFTYDIEDNDAVEMLMQIRNGSTVWYEEKITDKDKLTQGEHTWKWDGFDCDGIFDSAKLTKAKSLNFYAIGKDKEGCTDRHSIDFEANYEEVEWVDVKINKNTKRIDVTLRVNLKDGGAEGIECTEQIVAPDPIIIKECPWDKIPEKDLIPNRPPIKKRNEKNDFEALKQLALDGIEKYWQRNSTNIGKGVYVNKELYEVFINCKYDAEGMVAPEIIYFTNSENTTFNRSHNWFASRKLYYKEGYIKRRKWDYQKSSDAILDFQETSAHEIGHQLLVELDGKYHSYTHKGTSHPSVILQDPVKGTKYPSHGEEIDLMKYADDYLPSDYFQRVVLSEKDLLGLVWLTKLELE